MVLSSDSPLRLGIVGAGGFAEFVRDAARGVPEVEIVALYDKDAERARAVAGEAVVCDTLDDLLSMVDGVLIGTPPSTHAPIALAAARAGRHVFCEKPLAASVAEADEVAAAVRDAGTTLVVDHVIHYNPVVLLLAKLRERGVLGPVQRFLFENDAGDSDLGPDHWFWDEAVSGGIFVEHGVHFFDVAQVIVGTPAVEVQAMAARRPDGRIDTVVATARHEGGALATHAHGFSHPGAAERQLMRIDFGSAEARLPGWIPLEVRLDAFVGNAGLAVLEEVATEERDWLALPGFTFGPNFSVTLQVEPGPGVLHSRDADLPAAHAVRLVVRLGSAADKQYVYANSVRAALTDFARCARSGEPPIAGVDAGVATVRVAVAATRALAAETVEPVD